MPLREFSQWLVREADCSIVVEASVDESPVTMEVKEQSVEDVLSVVARRVGVQVNRSGSLYFIGALRREDRGLLVRRVRRLTRDQITAAVESVASDIASVSAFDDGLVVIGDRVEMLSKMQDLFDQIEAAEFGAWCVQLYLVSLSDTDVHKLGLDTKPSVDLAASFATSSAGAAVAPRASASAALRTLLDFVRENSSQDVMAEPLFLLADGGKSRLVRGERVPYQQQVTQTAGQPTAGGFVSSQTNFLQVGLELDIEIREQSPDVSALTVKVKNSERTGQVNGLPITTNEEIETRAYVRSGGVYLLGSLSRDAQTKGGQTGWYTGVSRSSERRQVLVWARCIKVDGPALPEAGQVERLPNG